MRVRILAFATARDALGAEEIELELPDGSGLDRLRTVLGERDPRFAELWPRLAIAVDGRLVRGDAELAEGQEVALMPPVSGGQDERAILVDGPLALADAIASVESPQRGAVVVFVGNVRDSHEERAVERLTYDAYRPMALVALHRIVTDVGDEAADLAVAIHHRLGEVGAGEASVVIAAAAPHRAAAYAASREALERLKREVPIWKQEHFVGGGALWREEEALTAEPLDPAPRSPLRAR
jgi:molybdopterin synthase catalytic subunit